MVKIYKQPFAHDGDTIAIPGASQPDGKMSSADGWTPDYQLPKTDPNYKPVGRQEMNGVFKEVTEALGQVQVQGSAAWSAGGAPYPINAQVYHSGKQWLALRENSVEPVEGEDWTELVGKQYIDANLPDLPDYLQPSMTGSIALDGTADNAVFMPDIVTELDLEIGDVIRIDTGAYNKLHTVEAISNNSSIRVNYEHAGNMGDGSLKLPDFTGQATVTRIAKWFSAPTGLGQEWLDVTDSRALGVTYTNTTGRAIYIAVSFSSRTNTDEWITIDGVNIVRSVVFSNTQIKTSLSAIIPDGSTYSCSGTSLQRWSELR